MTEQPLTVVITNYKRPEFLWKAFASCMEAGVERVVVSSSGADDAVKAVHARIKAARPSTIIISEDGDSGSNGNWLRGVEACQTEWVHILHDDDVLLKNFKLLYEHLGKWDFVCWDGRVHGGGSGLVKPYGPGIHFGENKCANLYRTLMQRVRPPSPVVGCFRRSHLLDVLRSCEAFGPEFVFRGKLLVGNDLLIWLEASQSLGSFFYLAVPITSFGSHPGSATIQGTSNGDTIMPFYDRTRRWFATELNRRKQPIEMHFLTIVLNGMPFIKWHHEELQKLKCQWTWHIVEGVAKLTHDTAWSVPSGGAIPPEFHTDDHLSVDGTTAYITELAAADLRVKIYRKPKGEPWDGKLEMVNAPLSSILNPCLLWQLDSDEIWTAEQLEQVAMMFSTRPAKTAAFYRCKFFVGPSLYISTVDCYSNNPEVEWLRTWRFQPGDTWEAHEPPILARDGKNVGRINPFIHAETAPVGPFHHFAYVTEGQVSFKERYYGYRGAVEGWRKLQEHADFPVKLSQFLPWVTDAAMVDKIRTAK